MADSAQAPMNGNYPVHHSYHDSYNHTPAGMNNAASFQPTQSSTPTNAPPNEQQKNGISKDEVGWYFVEQFYTNMSRSPEKLHLFYSRRSQLVFGTEAESVTVAVGTKAIQEKIKNLDFQECKVRVLNVDSQASFDNILVSVIGEISNKGEPSRKFVQTFVLAEQPNGYYVLNDIFRFMVDDEEIVNEETPSATAPAPAEAATSEVPAQVVAEAAPAAAEAQVDNESAAEELDEKLEQVEENGEELEPKDNVPQTNGAETKDSEVPQPVVPVTSEEALEDEKPISPEPTPVEPVTKEAPAPAPAKENIPPAKTLPKTWANIASKSGATVPPIPAIPVTSAKPAPAPAPVASQATPPPAVAAAPAATPTATPAAEATPVQPASNDSSGWQTAGHDHKKTQSRAGEEQNVLAYIKNVTNKVDANLLKQTLSRFGKLAHFDVSRQKNCAFVEFADAAGYTAAVAANPHQIGTEQIMVEERRARGQFGGNANYGAGRGGSGRGRGDRGGSQGRGGFQREGRGGYAPRGRGGNVNAKGRNQAPAA
ncbi:hypothetical protein FE257_012702 [Aspergillus nanangensis]|uniref:NTF2 and RRM domain protein n=1 Tax=Aspergillus nanangensis TaxID=2582783 RepID=A0AAD4GQK7_ASPNN|nr:hypothetical protein FE257_012702 [Aspergillus nanangensis]